MTSLISKIRKIISNNEKISGVVIKDVKIKKDENMSKNFVKCPKCNSEWNLNVRKNCPVCENVYMENSSAKESINKKVENDRDFVWETKIETIKDCSKAPKEQNVWLDPIAKTKISFLMKKFKNIEWLAYLLGEKKDDEFYINDIFIPNQKISTASVDNVVCPEYNSLPIIGVIHSHHNMGHDFSGVDDEWINQNHDLSIVVSHSGISGQIRYKTPCGSYIVIKANVKLNLKIELDKEAFEKEIDEKIKKDNYTYKAPVYQNDEIYGPYTSHVRGPYQPTSFNKKKFFNGGAVTKDVEKRFKGKLTINDKRKLKNNLWNTEDGDLEKEMEKIEKEMAQKDAKKMGH